MAPAMYSLQFTLVHGSPCLHNYLSSLFGFSLSPLCFGGLCLHISYRSRQQHHRSFSQTLRARGVTVPYTHSSLTPKTDDVFTTKADDNPH